MACLFVEQLCVIDCAWLHPDLGLLGDSWIVDLELEGRLDEQGMVLDFGRVKPVVKEVIDESVDHKLVVPGRSPALEISGTDTDTRLKFRYGKSEFFHRSPSNALCVLDCDEVSLRAVEEHLANEIAAVMPTNVSDIRVSLREEEIAGPSYRYVHGLREHEGNCQRIAHGHRSRIVIFRDGKRSEACERWLAERWRDIYLGCRVDLLGETQCRTGAFYHFGYDAPQGRFELVIDKDRCELIDSESTVECIAEHVVELLKQRDPAAAYRVRAYEGVRKGATAETQDETE